MLSKTASRLQAETNPLYALRERVVADGHVIVDLISGNVTEHGIAFPEDLLADILSRCAPICSSYRPDSLGQVRAREAIGSYYAGRGLAVDSDCILLTPGTSVAYWYCFKLLADEGDEILSPQPSYPLFDYIAALCGVRMIPYRMDEKRGWGIDLEHLEASISNRSRAVVLISPHNPTGHVATRAEVEALADIARRHSLALISDEVFSEFLLKPDALPSPAGTAAPLVCTLNGFSKMYALPGLKLGWIAVTGEGDRVREALRSLELISDTFLPVSEIAQAAVPDIFERGQPFLCGYRAAILERWQAASTMLSAGRRYAWVEPDGGFHVALRLEGIDEEKAALALLSEGHMLLHPGYYYDMRPHHLIMSFIHEPRSIRSIVPRLQGVIERLRDELD